MLVETDYFMTDEWRDSRQYKKVVMISGGFDPIHIGHLQYIIEASQLSGRDGILIAVINGDGFLDRKKQYHFQPEYERAKIVNHFKGVTHTVIWDDGTQYVDGALRLVQPDVFAKGGDRSSEQSMPDIEVDLCSSLNIQLEFGVGGVWKLNSSSELVENFQKLKNDA